MRKTLLLFLVVVLVGASLASASVSVGGYMAPRLMMADRGEDNKSNVGFGMYFNRFAFSGSVEGGKIVKKVGFLVETDISGTTNHTLQWSYVQPYFTEAFSIKLGHLKRQFSRELLHSTSNLLTAERHPTSSFLTGLHYGNYTYGLEAHYAANMFKLAAGAYSGGAPQNVTAQDPALDYAIRAILMPTAGLEVGVNAAITTLPIGGINQGAYVDSTYESNSGMAYGFDVDYQKAFGKMNLWAQAELGMGDSWDLGAKEAAAGDTWEDFEWYSFMYYYFKFRLMFTEEFGVHFGYSSIDCNTDEDAGKNDETTLITPGLTYFWTPLCRTEVEVQMHTMGGGVDMLGEELDDIEYTHFVLQQVLVWK